MGDEPTIQQVTQTAGAMSEEEMFNALEQPGQRLPYTLDDLLSLASEGDRQILELVFVQGLRGKSLAAQLGLSEGGARMKRGRAVARLSKAFKQDEVLIEEAT